MRFGSDPSALGERRPTRRRGRQAAALAATLLLSACASSPKPFLWKLSKEGRESYLFGTLHSGVQASELSPVVFDRLRASGAYVGELDVRPDPKIPPSLELSHSTAGLDQLLSAESWAALKGRLNGVPEERLRRMNPFFAMYLLNDVERRESGGIEPPAAKRMKEKLETPSMDDALIAEARERGMVISFLEERTPTLRACVEVAVARELDERLRKKPNEPESSAEADRIAAAYRKGDFRALEEIEAAEEKETAAAGECSIGARNRAWAEKIDRLHGVYAPAFIAVGVGHAVTPTDSLLALLKSRGFSVERSTPAR